MGFNSAFKGLKSDKNNGTVLYVKTTRYILP